MKYTTLLSLVAALPGTYGVAFGGPEPTALGAGRVFGGMSPKPTKAPSVNELRTRQSSVDPETCGWVDAEFCKSSRHGGWPAELEANSSKHLQLHAALVEHACFTRALVQAWQDAVQAAIPRTVTGLALALTAVNTQLVNAARAVCSTPSSESVQMHWNPIAFP
jgi:hypothetical protein